MKVLGKTRSIRMVFKISVILLITFFLNYLFRQHLYNHSILTIIRIQRHETLTLNYFFNFLVDLCDSRLVGLIFVVSNIVAKDKNYILSLLMYFLGCIWVSIVLKLLYGDPRPFWTSSVVKNLGDNCQFDYGNPFGSGISPILLFQSIIVHAIGLGKYGYHLLLPAILSILIPFGGLYLGIASINQILLGIILNLSALLFFKLFVADFLTKLLKQVSYHTQEGKGMMIGIIFLHLFTIFVPLSIFLYRPQPSLQRAVLINVGNSCQVIPSTLRDINFQMLLLSAVFNVCFGYCYGYYIDGKTQRRITKRWSLPESLAWLKFIIDCLLLLLPVISITYIYNRYHLQQSYLVYLGISLAYIIIGYIQIRWSPMLRLNEPINPMSYNS